MSENYVKFKTNIGWYEMKTLVHLTLYECLAAFLRKIVNGDTWGEPVMAQELADELGASYTIEDPKGKTIPNPFYGTESFGFNGFDEHGDFIFGEPEIDTNKTITTVPLGKGIVAANIGPALDSLISEYNACEYDELDAWFDKASKIVPFLWD